MFAPFRRVGGKRTSVEMGFSVVLYFRRPWRDVDAIVDAVRTFYERLPAKTLRHAWRSSYLAALKAPGQALARFRKSVDAYGGGLIYWTSASEEGEAPETSVWLQLSSESNPIGQLQLELAADDAASMGAEGLWQWLMSLAATLPFDQGHAGWATHLAARSHNRDHRAGLSVVSECIGACSEGSMAAWDPPNDTVIDIGWVTFLGERLAKLFGDADDVARVTGATVAATTRGLVIRASRVPPVGVLEANAPDLGRLPAVLQLLASRRAAPRSDGDTTYRERCASRASGAWDNLSVSPIVW